MSTKRAKRNFILDSAMNNSHKKSKDTVNAESKDVSYNNVKSKKKDNTNVPSHEKKVGDNKRKLSDSEAVTPAPKKAKKKGTAVTDINSTVNEDFVPVSSNNIPMTNEPKKSKRKNKVPMNIEECSIENNPNNTVNVLESFVQKTGKKRHKLNKNKASDNQIIPIIEKEDSIYFKDDEYEGIDINNLNSGNIKMDQYVENGTVHLSIKDTEDNHFETNDMEPFLDVKKEKNAEKPKKKKQFINWPEEDLQQLIQRMEACIPENDALAFATRAEKLEWDSVVFKEYSVEECKKMWYLLQKQIRKFRLLKEVLADAKEWIAIPGHIKKKKLPIHPDMPRKPLSPYFIYYMQRRNDFSKTNPGLDAAGMSKTLSQEYKSLGPDKKLKYENLAVKEKKEYQKKLEEFYQAHPEIPRIVKAKREKKVRKPKPPKLPKPIKEKPPKKERVPKRPPPPFHYYYLSELEKQKEVEDRLAFKELCKERWKELSDEKKVVWINSAETEYAKYEEALTKYLQNHPEYVQNPHKPILTKEEVQIKDRVAGKPTKPPGSAYNLFARVMLQSVDIKNVAFKDRLNFVSNQWKSCTDDEKKHYRDLLIKLNEKYKLDYASYLETLPEEEKKIELEKQTPKKRKPESLEPTVKKEKEKVVKKKSEKKATSKKIVEPEQPPISPYKYFASIYTGKEPVLQAWKSLSSEEKKKYEDELVEKKQAYIKNFEKFLKSLSKEELEAFSNSRRRTKEEDDEEEEEVTETSDESGTEDSCVESNDDEDEDTVN